MRDDEIIKALEELELYDGFQPKIKILIHNAIYLIDRQKAEIESLKDELHRAKVEISKHFDYMDKVESEAIDVFANSLKSKLNRTIDNLVKEMTEENENDRA